MEFLWICLAAALASLLTLFSGFGLGTLLMPVVAIFFPLDVAVAITAVVHLANNVFKLGLLARAAHWATVARFGLPAVLAAFVGASLLAALGELPSIASYELAGRDFQVLPIKLLIGLLIIVFVVLELLPWFARLAMPPKWLPLGGLLSGFFGGLSGHQGAFRSMFLLKLGLSKQQFVASGVIIAVMVDVCRLGVYGWDFGNNLHADATLVGAACLAAFAGAYLGAKWVNKVTIVFIQRLVSVLLLLVALGLILGWL